MLTPRQKMNSERSGLRRIFDPKVVRWLDQKTQNLLLDYISIKKGHEYLGIEGLCDYSYLIAPAYKALEGTFIQIGIETKVIKNDVKRLNWKFYGELKSHIERRGIEETKQSELKRWVDNTEIILKLDRHNQAHYSEESIENWDRAFLIGDDILRTINEICRCLLEAKIIALTDAESEIEKAYKKAKAKYKRNELKVRDYRQIGII